MPSASLDTDAKYTNLVEIYNNLNKATDTSKSKIFENVFEALNWLTDQKDQMLTTQQNSTNVNIDQKINVLITGSLYLVG